jgi:uncharacterized protein
MTLPDAGPLVALLDKRDPYHTVAVVAAGKLPAGPLVTTWPCLSEAMYLIGRAAGWAGQAELWGWVAAGQVVVREAGPGGRPGWPT